METHVEIRWPGIPNWHPTHYGYDVVCGYDKREIDDAGAIVRCAMWRDGAYVAGPQQGAVPEAGKAPPAHADNCADWGGYACSCGLIPPKDVAPKPAPEVAPVHVIPYPKLQPGFYGPGIGEMLRPYEKRDAVTGMPLTALEAIRSRKPPEPWIPSIDDWDLLPDQ